MSGINSGIGAQPEFSKRRAVRVKVIDRGPVEEPGGSLSEPGRHATSELPFSEIASSL
jgi:hypothetical protein